MTTKKKPLPPLTPMGSSPEYMAQYRLRLNPDVYSRIRIKSKRYLSIDQAREIERQIDAMLGIEPRDA